MNSSEVTSLLARKNEIIKRAVGIDYQQFERSPIAFDYEGLLAAPGFTPGEVRRIQFETGVGQTPLVELKNITRLIRLASPPGKGARIFIKDERSNPSGSFKDRRASLSAFHAARAGYEGIVCASSGNYGAAVASQAAKFGLKAEEMRAALNDAAIKELVKAEVDKAIARGAFGSPYIVVGEEAFWGADRLEQIEKWLASGGWTY